MAIPLEQYANLSSSTLNGAITATATTLVVNAASAFPGAPQFRIKVDNELMLVTAVSGATFTVTRGSEGTIAATHANGALVAGVLTVASFLNNPGPMTAAGDIIYMASTGLVTNLPIGATSTVLVVAAGLPTWSNTPAAGGVFITDATNVAKWLLPGQPGTLFTGNGAGAAPTWAQGPMTGAGDMIVGGGSGIPVRLGAGSNTAVLTITSGTPTWTGAGLDGAVLYVNGVGVVAWLGAGTAGKFLTMSSGSPALPMWGQGPATTDGDLILGATAGTPTRLGVGSAGQILTVVSGLPAWNYSTTSVVTTLPASPPEGTLVLYEPVGRKWIMIFSSGTWQALFGLSFATTLYVDNVNGTDDVFHGSGTGTNAYRSIQFAFNQLPRLNFAGATINLTAGQTYTENLILSGKDFASGTVAQVQGTRTTTVSDTVSTASNTGSSPSGQGTLTATTGGYTIGAFNNTMIRFTSGVLANQYFIIDSNTATAINIAGQWPTVPATGDAFVVENWNNTINGGTGVAVHLNNQQINVIFDSIAITRGNTGGTEVAVCEQAASVKFQRCSLAYGTHAATLGAINCQQCYAQIPGTGGWPYALDCETGGSIIFQSGKLNQFITTNIGVFAHGSANLILGPNSIYDGNGGASTTGVQAQVAAFVNCYGITVRNWGTGLKSTNLSQIFNTGGTFVAFSGNTVNTSADATTFALIN